MLLSLYVSVPLVHIISCSGFKYSSLQSDKIGSSVSYKHIKSRSFVRIKIGSTQTSNFHGHQYDGCDLPRASFPFELYPSHTSSISRKWKGKIQNPSNDHSGSISWPCPIHSFSMRDCANFSTTSSKLIEQADIFVTKKITSKKISRRKFVQLWNFLFACVIFQLFSANLYPSLGEASSAFPLYFQYIRPSSSPFSLGVASGDPSEHSVIIWTRVAPKPQDGPLAGMQYSKDHQIPVEWTIAKDARMKKVIQTGTSYAQAENAYSVLVQVDSLEPNSWYWYAFQTQNSSQIIGRTRTLPATDDQSVQDCTFAFISCQNFEEGYFSALRHIAAEPHLDFVIHLGDYIYEKKHDVDRKTPRAHPPYEAVDLSSYRSRYALYKTDPDLQLLHCLFPFFCIWDDHEVQSDYANIHSSRFVPENIFQKRRNDAYQAYCEHIPLRVSRKNKETMTRIDKDIPQEFRVYRSMCFGSLLQFNFLDTRQYRSPQACQTPDMTHGGGHLINCPELWSNNRTLLGETQDRWLQSSLERSTAQWNVIAQQYLFATLKQVSERGETLFWSDNWDGYPYDRQRLLNLISERRIRNPVFIGGDIHSFLTTDLKLDFDNPDSSVVATEFVCTSVSAKGISYDKVARVLPRNPHIKFFESRLRGYAVCRVNKTEWITDFRIVDTVESPKSTIRTLAKFKVVEGQPGAESVSV